MSVAKEMLDKTISLTTALLSGEVVSEETIKRRIEICSTCPLVKLSGKGQTMSCGVCGCRLRGDKSLMNLARYEETKSYGCKHPAGSRWRKAGV